MKKIVSLLFTVFLASGSYSQNDVEAASSGPSPEIAVGLAYGRGFPVIEWYHGSWLFPGPQLVEISSSPVVTLDYQQPIVRKFCMGLAASHQSIRVGYKDGFTVYDYGDRYDRLNIAVRPLFNFPVRSRLNLYAGLRLGMTFWTFTSISTPKENYKDRVMPTFASGGIFAGARVFFGRIGVGTELAFGTAPYLIQGHVIYRFGKLDR